VLFRSFLNDVCIEFPEDSSITEMAGYKSGQTLNYDGIIQVLNEIETYNKQKNVYSDRIFCKLTVPFFNRKLELRLFSKWQLANTCGYAYLQSESIEDHPYYKGCQIASELCNFLIKENHYNYYANRSPYYDLKNKELLFMDNAVERNSIVYAVKKGIYVDMKPMGGGFSRMLFKDTSFVREHAPFLTMITRNLKAFPVRRF
jgi:hypothetical protein